MEDQGLAATLLLANELTWLYKGECCQHFVYPASGTQSQFLVLRFDV